MSAGKEQVDHPDHYGGESNPFEVIKIIEAFDHISRSFCLGNTVKYLLRAGKKGPVLVDLEKAAWYLNREIEQRKKSS